MVLHFLTAHPTFVVDFHTTCAQAAAGHSKLGAILTDSHTSVIILLSRGLKGMTHARGGNVSSITNNSLSQTICMAMNMSSVQPGLTCVKCPALELHPGLLKLYRETSLYLAGREERATLRVMCEQQWACCTGCDTVSAGLSGWHMHHSTPACLESSQQFPPMMTTAPAHHTRYVIIVAVHAMDRYDDHVPRVICGCCCHGLLMLCTPAATAAT